MFTKYTINSAVFFISMVILFGFWKEEASACHYLQISVGSGRCHHWRRALPSLAAAAANHVPARCQPKNHAPFPSAVPPAPCLSCAAAPECAPFRSSSTMLHVAPTGAFSMLWYYHNKRNSECAGGHQRRHGQCWWPTVFSAFFPTVFTGAEVAKLLRRNVCEE